MAELGNCHFCQKGPVPIAAQCDDCGARACSSCSTGAPCAQCAGWMKSI